jgi:hypothetical protein
VGVFAPELPDLVVPGPFLVGEEVVLNIVVEERIVNSVGVVEVHLSCHPSQRFLPKAISCSNAHHIKYKVDLAIKKPPR